MMYVTVYPLYSAHSPRTVLTEEYVLKATVLKGPLKTVVNFTLGTCSSLLHGWLQTLLGGTTRKL